MERASNFIAELQATLDEESKARKIAEETLAIRTDELQFTRRELEAERTAHDEKTLAHGGRIRELEKELVELRATLGAEVTRLQKLNAELEEAIAAEREERAALNKQLADFREQILSLERTRAAQLALIKELRDERSTLLRTMPTDRSATPKKLSLKLNVHDILSREINPVQEMDMLQNVLLGRKIVMQELYKYYAWTPEPQGSTRQQKLRMSVENFVKMCTDAQLLSTKGGFTPVWAENIFIASCLKRYAKQRGHAYNSDGKAMPVSERYLKLDEFLESIVRLSYSRYSWDDAPNLTQKVERCLDEKFVPFAKHKGSSITNWFSEVCAAESLNFISFQGDV